MTMPAMAPLEAESLVGEDEAGAEEEVAVAALKEEMLEPCGRASPGLRASVVAAAARFWTEI